MSIVPFLAPLFDKMTSHAVAERFSAEEALHFIERAKSEIPDTDLHTAFIGTKNAWDMGFNGTYWNLLSPQFRARWVSYVSPPRTFGDKVVDVIAWSEMASDALCFTRRILRI